MDLPRSGGRARLQSPIRWCTTASRRGWCASWSRRDAGARVRRPLADCRRCCCGPAPTAASRRPAAPPSPPRRRRRWSRRTVFRGPVPRDLQRARARAGRRGADGLADAVLHSAPDRLQEHAPMNARTRAPLKPAQLAALSSFADERLGRAHRARARPTTSRSRPRARCSTPTGRSTATSTAWCATPRPGSRARKVAGPEARSGAPRGPHAGDLLRGAGHQARRHRHRAACTATSTSSPSSTAGAATSGPWTPKVENGLLYGRGGADDGYAVYAAHHRDRGARRARASRARAASA